MAEGTSLPDVNTGGITINRTCFYHPEKKAKVDCDHCGKDLCRKCSFDEIDVEVETSAAVKRDGFNADEMMAAPWMKDPRSGHKDVNTKHLCADCFLPVARSRQYDIANRSLFSSLNAARKWPMAKESWDNGIVQLIMGIVLGLPFVLWGLYGLGEEEEGAISGNDFIFMIIFGISLLVLLWFVGLRNLHKCVKAAARNRQRYDQAFSVASQ